MVQTYDCIVLGVGGFGSGALFHAARRSARVLGVEQFGIAHDRGSSHGETRIIRQAYFEHPDYVPLLRRAYELWRELESDSNRRLMHLCGLLLAGPAEGEAISGARLAAEQHGLDIETVDSSAAARRFPGFRIPAEFAIVFEGNAGYLEVENCVRAHVECGLRQGAVLRTEETVHEWTSDGRTVRLRTDRGEYSAGRLIITAGAWADRLLHETGVALSVLRKPVFWHPVTAPVYNVAEDAPTFYCEMPYGAFYGFPSLDARTVKLAEHSGGDRVNNPHALERTTTAADHQSVRRFVAEVMPGLAPQAARSSICMYTMSPDGHFLVDRHPEYENVVFGAGFSGHGFKFTGVLGEALADLALEGRTDLPVGFLKLDRPGLR